jgi:2',3'-cyclic-nucleotide 2'-phosphodiesterase
MKILFLGDLVGRSGRTAVIENIPLIQEKLALDAIIVNVEKYVKSFLRQASMS